MHPTGPAYATCRSRHLDEFQAGVAFPPNMNLGVTKTHSRPHVSNDNPYSESQFRTLKYRPEFPDRFGCRIQDSRAFCQGIFSLVQREISPPLEVSATYSRPAMVHYEPDGPSSRTAPTSTRCRLSTSSGTLRAKALPDRPPSPPRRGSTKPVQLTMKKLTKFREHVSQGR